MIQAIEEAVSDFSDNLVHGDMRALGTEVSTAFVSSPGWEEGSVMGEDFEGNHLQFFEDADQDMKDFVIERLPNTFTEIRQGSFTGDPIERDTGIGSIGPAPVIIAQNRQDLVGIETSVQETEKIDQEDTGRVVARGTERGVAVGYQGTNEGEIDQRRDHPGKPPSNGTIGEDFDESFFELIVGEQGRIRKRPWVRKQNFSIDLVEFCANMIYGESFKRGHHNGSPGQERSLLPNLFNVYFLGFTKFLPEVFPQGIRHKHP